MDNENVYEKVTSEMAKMYAEEFTETEYARLDEKFSPQGYFDTLAFAREKLKKGIDVPNYKLESLVKYYFPNNHFEFHNASEDVNATLNILMEGENMSKEINAKLPEIIVFAGPNGSGKTTITKMAKTVGQYINSERRCEYSKS